MKTAAPRRELLGQRVLPDLRAFSYELVRRVEDHLGLPAGQLNAGYGTEVALSLVRYILDRAPKSERWTLDEILGVPIDDE